MEIPFKLKYAPFEYTLGMIGGKRKIKVIHQIKEKRSYRY